jgi:hypothetical protein
MSGGPRIVLHRPASKWAKKMPPTFQYGGIFVWRRDPESNWARRICNPLHNRFAIAPKPDVKQEIWASHSSERKILPCHWSGKRGSNSRPQPWQGCALPTELFPHVDDSNERCWHFFHVTGAGNEARTRDLNLGKVALYQLSYSRILQRTWHCAPRSMLCLNCNAIPGRL